MAPSSSSLWLKCNFVLNPIRFGVVELLASSGVLTHSQKKNAISNAFWNRTMSIKWRTNLGRWNQNKSSEGVTATSPSIAVCFWTTWTANSVMICSILLPTTSSTCKEENTLNMLHNFNFQTIIR